VLMKRVQRGRLIKMFVPELTRINSEERVGTWGILAASKER
jgi:hypothetical protein